MPALVVTLAIFLAGGAALFVSVRRHYEAEFRRIAARTSDQRAATEVLLAHRLTGMIW